MIDIDKNNLTLYNYGTKIKSLQKGVNYMAKLYKFTGYLLDINEVYSSPKDIIEDISPDVGLSLHDIQEVDVDWDDDIDLNRGNCTREEKEKYFKNK